MIREVTRLITYRGPAAAMDVQLGRSLPDGVRPATKGVGQVEITVRTLEDSAGLLIGTADPLSALLKRLTQLELELGAAKLAARDAENKMASATAGYTAEYSSA